MFPIALHFLIPGVDVDPCRAGQIEISSLWHPYTGVGRGEGIDFFFLASPARLDIRVGLRNEGGRPKLFVSHTLHSQFHDNVRQIFCCGSGFENVEANLSQSVL
jgi:hypothetical protein